MVGMPEPKGVEGAFRVGGIEAWPDRNLLRSQGGSRHLEPKVMDVLRALAVAPRTTVLRSALIDEVWGVAHGGDESLTRAVSILRKAFRDLAPDTTLIETVPKRGYRLMLDPEPIHRKHPTDDQDAEDGAMVVIALHRNTLMLFAILLMLGAGAGLRHGDAISDNFRAVVGWVVPGDASAAQPDTPD